MYFLKQQQSRREMCDCPCTFFDILLNSNIVFMLLVNCNLADFMLDSKL